MSWVNDVLGDFGRSLGIDGLSFNDRGVASLQFEVLGNLYIEHVGDNILVYVTREIDHPNGRIYAAALELCHWQHNHPFSVNAALRGDRQLVFAVNLTETEFSVPVMRQLLQFFSQLHQQVMEGRAA